MVKITVVTITYNAASVLSPTLKSVAEQSYNNIEHWIIDGASSDSTMEIAHRYADENGGRYDIKLLSEPDDGLYYAMNKGLQRATGDYIVFMNAGDRFAASDTLERVAKAVEECQITPAVVYGDTDIVDSDGRFLCHRHLSAPKKLTWRSFIRGMLVCHQAFYALTGIARNIPYDTQFRHSADVDWCIRVMREGKKRGLPNCNVGAVVALFLAGGDSDKNHATSLRERFQVMSHHYGIVPTALMHLYFVLRAVFRKIG